MSHAEICRTYSDESLAGIVRQLSTTRERNQWITVRLKAASLEIQRRRALNINLRTDYALAAAYKLTKNEQ